MPILRREDLDPRIEGLPLQRFLDAQADHYESVLRELRSGRKATHWMWYIFPQIRGLGSSTMSERYAISGRAEAVAYLEHAILGPRLTECTQLVVDVQGRSVEEIFSYPDDLKFRSSMTLFAETANDPRLFRAALDKYYRGQPDSLTLDILRRQVR